MNDPIARFLKTYERAKNKDPGDYTRGALATAGKDGRPSVRMVLLRGVDERGFVFYTNYGSRKAAELEANPRASLCFYWECIKEQVRVEGVVERATDDESDAYFASRNRGSQLGAWSSKQSSPLESRTALVTGYIKLKAQYAGRPIPRPDFWGGFRIRPDRVEFWSSKAHRMHDRVAYVREGDDWTIERLYP
jgi:pyridoxamine 5'-phosphate oxidase